MVPNAEKWWTGEEAQGKGLEINEVASAVVATMEDKVVWHPPIKSKGDRGNSKR